MSFSTVATVIVAKLSNPLLSPYPLPEPSLHQTLCISTVECLGPSACSEGAFPYSSSLTVRSSCSCRRRASSLSEKALSGHCLACIAPVGQGDSSRPDLSSPLSPLKEALCFHPLIREDLAEIVPPTIRKESDNRLLFTHSFPDLQSREDCCPPRSADKYSLFPSDSPRKTERVPVSDRDNLVYHFHLQC